MDNLRQWREWSNLEADAKKQLQRAIAESYLEGIQCPHRVFIAVRVRDILQHVFYQLPIDRHMCAENKARLDKPWDGLLRFATLVLKFHAVQEFAQDAGRPIAKNDIMDALYNVILATGLYLDDCKKWDEEPAVDKTWANVQTHFLQAQMKLTKCQKATTRQSDFHGQCGELRSIGKG